MAGVVRRFSLLRCPPVQMAEQPSAGTGTVMRPDAPRAYPREAGFGDVEIPPIENDLCRCHRLVNQPSASQVACATTSRACPCAGFRGTTG